jgi:hypothetical protein
MFKPPLQGLNSPASLQTLGLEFFFYEPLLGVAFPATLQTLTF